jgi:ectoine hydroxylase-related dioxygenase (phytanoyl-CoA dioxygenase family)
MSSARLRQCPPAPSAQDWAEELLHAGYCIIPDAAPVSLVKALSADLDERFQKTPFCQGGFYGRRTKRFHGLLKRSRYAAPFVANRLILDVVDQILSPHCDMWQLNLTQALELHPGQRSQAPHRDQDMWRGAAGKAEYLVNVMWPFTPYTARNGATIVWPGSHKRLDEEMIDPAEAIAAEIEPGSALLFLGSTLHGAGANVSSAARRGMIVSYCLGWLKPYENQWLTYPPAIARTFPPELAALVGYREHRPNLGNYDGQCPSILLKGEPADHLGAIDNLRPEQIQRLEEYIAATGGPEGELAC